MSLRSRWEYKVIEGAGEDELNALGARGWEAVSVEFSNGRVSIALFKRLRRRPKRQRDYVDVAAKYAYLRDVIESSLEQVTWAVSDESEFMRAAIGHDANSECNDSLPPQLPPPRLRRPNI